MKILGYDYTVVEAAESEEFGSFDAQQQQIIISADLCKEQQVSTALHEVIEVVNYHLDLELEHSSIMALETALYQVFTDNKIDLSVLLNSIKTGDSDGA
jgi:hypothetical protein